MSAVTTIRLADQDGLDLQVSDIHESTWNGWTIPYVTADQAIKIFSDVAQNDTDAPRVDVTMSGTTLLITTSEDDTTTALHRVASDDDGQYLYALDGFTFVDHIHHPGYFTDVTCTESCCD